MRFCCGVLFCVSVAWLAQATDPSTDFTACQSAWYASYCPFCSAVVSVTQCDEDLPAVLGNNNTNTNATTNVDSSSNSNSNQSVPSCWKLMPESPCEVGSRCSSHWKANSGWMFRHRICESAQSATTSSAAASNANPHIIDVVDTSDHSQSGDSVDTQVLVGMLLQDKSDIPPSLLLNLEHDPVPELAEAEETLRKAISEAQIRGNTSIGEAVLPPNFFVPHVDPIPEVIALREAHKNNRSKIAARTSGKPNNPLPLIWKNMTLIAGAKANITDGYFLEGQMNVQYTVESGEVFASPLTVEVKTSAVDNGWWGEEFSCCHNFDVNRIISPPVTWDGGGTDTMSYVVMIDDMDDDAAIEWLMVNIDPRDHKIPRAASGECPWWKLLWPWRYGYCYRHLLPGSAMELPNRDSRWRFRGFCPPNHQVHRYRLRVFAQYEWDQRYLKIPYPYNADAVANQLMHVGKNLGFATIIANGGRQARCNGAERKPLEGYLDGIVADYDFSRKNLSSVVGNVPPIVDIGAQCTDSHMKARFVGNSVRKQWTTVLDVPAGTGLAFNASNVLPSGDGTQYSVVFDVRFARTSCFVRLLNLNASDSFGVYLCDNVYVYPNARVGPYLAPRTWHHIVITTEPSKYTQIFVNGQLQYGWTVPNDVWARALQRQPQYAGTPAPDNLMVFFNDCGYVCRCANGEGQQSQVLVKRIQIYNRPLTPVEVASLFKMQTTNFGG
eukprot:c9670_g1_i1.p1 GENE.c9670_g1_i1~~c9670_g1_i1.p1  ORF type:complete len:741 (+),score=155.42 c9670_g1_i1:57-2225(+)